MILTRISAFFLVVPVFGWTSIPVRIKISMTLLLTIFFSMITPVPIKDQHLPVLEAILMMVNEATYGFAMGLILALLFAAVKFSGRIVEREMGLAMASILDPLTGEDAQPLGSLIEMMFTLLFLSANGHHLFLLILSKSYETFPAGTIPSVTILLDGIVRAGSTMLIAGLKLAAPILAAFLVLLVVLAILARMVQEMNILFISLPLRVALGLFMVVVFLPLMSTFVSEIADLMGQLLPI
ncbi:MAG: flagellar biosynthetic protein FliR [Sedimentisphaerales bacterium]|nr:flagellar biosynthetic protein FliR [Sedimentisphaerales bacterium]